MESPQAFYESSVRNSKEYEATKQHLLSPTSGNLVSAIMEDSELLDFNLHDILAEVEDPLSVDAATTETLKPAQPKRKRNSLQSESTKEKKLKADGTITRKCLRSRQRRKEFSDAISSLRNCLDLSVKTDKLKVVLNAHATIEKLKKENEELKKLNMLNAGDPQNDSIDKSAKPDSSFKDAIARTVKKITGSDFIKPRQTLSVPLVEAEKSKVPELNLSSFPVQAIRPPAAGWMANDNKDSVSIKLDEMKKLMLQMQRLYDSASQNAEKDEIITHSHLA